MAGMKRLLETVSLVHMVDPSKFYSRTPKYCVESRDPVTGNLTTDLKLPFMEATENQLCSHYFNSVPGKGGVAQEVIAAWYNAQGWYFRPKTW